MVMFTHLIVSDPRNSDSAIDMWDNSSVGLLFKIFPLWRCHFQVIY